MTERNKLKHSLDDLEAVKANNERNDVLNEMKIGSIDSKMSDQNTNEGGSRQSKIHNTILIVRTQP